MAVVSLSSIKLQLPTNKKIIFSYGELYDEPKWWSPNRVHYGVDFDCDFEPVYAAHDGTCTIADDGTGWGKYVKIRADGYETIYAHLSEYSVKSGQKVKTGDVIGISGNSGSAAEFRHLHFELRVVSIKNVDTGPRWQQNPLPCFTATADLLPPTPTPVVLKDVKRCRITGGAVNIRSIPQMGNNILYMASMGTEFDTKEEMFGEWMRVFAYVHKDYVQVK